jgi:hypothetical protein
MLYVFSINLVKLRVRKERQLFKDGVVRPDRRAEEHTRPCLDPFSFCQFLRIWFLKIEWDPNMLVFAVSFCQIHKTRKLLTLSFC